LPSAAESEGQLINRAVLEHVAAGVVAGAVLEHYVADALAERRAVLMVADAASTNTPPAPPTETSAQHDQGSEM
jgi:hypothetical protein